MAAKKTATKRPQSKAVKVGRAPSAKSRRTPAKADELSNLWPPANELLEKIALAEAEKATEAAHKHAQAEAEKSDQLSKTLGISDEEVMKSAAALVEQAVRAGLTEVQVYRFPNILCTDHGRAINQQEPGWEDTLTGVPKQLYQFWHDPAPARVQVTSPDRRLSRRTAGRCQHDAEVGLSDVGSSR